MKIDHAEQNYGISRWGDGYFQIQENGHLAVTPDQDRDIVVDLPKLVESARSKGLDLPLLVRFSDILGGRVKSLCRAFQTASVEYNYQGSYSAIYPIKVNQQRIVVEDIINSGDNCVGLEAGSKPELMAVLALSPKGGIIVCNGYKDREYIRLALIGTALGMRIYIVIEKLSELQIILEESHALDIEPLLGVRVRLAASAAGNWQNSGGEKAKFGLTPTQILQLVAELKKSDSLKWLQLLHSHIGSQIPNLRDIGRGITESTRYYAELRRLGADIRVVDVGGGLGIDYEGTSTRSDYSLNYNIESYAREITKSLKRIAVEMGLPEPDIFSESGRAMTAHHAVLITNVIERESPPTRHSEISAENAKSDILPQLEQDLRRAATDAPPQEVYEDARINFEESRAAFESGRLTIEEWASAEQIYYDICRLLRQRLNPHKRRNRELLDHLNEQLAEKAFLNFSLFQSIPDAWAIKQLFPIVPLQRLNESPQSHAILHDLTCDSDGCISNYVDQDGVESTFPLHEQKENEEYLLGIFLVGAYQEILGDMHNLFGDTHAINVRLTGDSWQLVELESGDSVDELLRYVHFDTDEMLNQYRSKLDASSANATQKVEWLELLEAGLHGYTYMEK